MKTRVQIYSHEASGILRDISTYGVLTQKQILGLYPQKDAQIKNLLAYLCKQKRLFLVDSFYSLMPELPKDRDRGLEAAVTVLADFMEQVEYHAAGEYPVKIIFLAGGEVYEILYAEPGKEAILNLLVRNRNHPCGWSFWKTLRRLICLPFQMCAHTACWMVMEVFNIFKNSCKRTDAKSASVQKINYINYISVVAIYCCHQPSVRSEQRRFHLLICDLAPCPTSRERFGIVRNRNAFNRIDRVGSLDRSNSAVLYLIHNNRSFHTSYFLSSV